MLHFDSIRLTVVHPGAEGPAPPECVVFTAGRRLGRVCRRDAVHPLRLTHTICIAGEGFATFVYGYELAPGTGSEDPLAWFKRQQVQFRFGTLEELDQPAPP